MKSNVDFLVEGTHSENKVLTFSCHNKLYLYFFEIFLFSWKGTALPTTRGCHVYSDVTQKLTNTANDYVNRNLRKSVFMCRIIGGET